LALPLAAIAACHSSPISDLQAGSGGAAGAGGIAGEGGTGGVAPDGAVGGSAGQETSCLPLQYGPDDVQVGGVIATDAGVAAARCPTTDTRPSDAAALRVYKLVEPTEHARLEQVVGRYVCGTASIYRGSFSAADNQSSVGGVEGVIATGPVVASLEDSSRMDFLTCQQTVMGVRALVVFAAGQSRAIRLFQILGGTATTYSSLVAMPNTLWSGVSASCDGCVGDLRPGAPASIAIGPTTLTGQYCDGSTPLEVSVSGQLNLLASPSVDDILGVNQPYGAYQAPPSFVLQGDDMVTTVSGFLLEVADPILMGGTATPYSVDWYVNRQNPAVFGLRNFSIGSPRVICRHPAV
jgi:hypothetical protein